LEEFKKILFVTTANLATNPRLVKELQLVNSNPSLKAKVVLFNLGNWSDQIDAQIRKSFPEIEFAYLMQQGNHFFLGCSLQ